MSYPIITRVTAVHPVELLNKFDRASIRLQIACIEKDALVAENERLRAWGHAAYRWLGLCCPMADAYRYAPESVKVARWLDTGGE